jgi:hypothetical protein
MFVTRNLIQPATKLGNVATNIESAQDSHCRE